MSNFLGVTWTTQLLGSTYLSFQSSFHCVNQRLAIVQQVHRTMVFYCGYWTVHSTQRFFEFV